MMKEHISSSVQSLRSHLLDVIVPRSAMLAFTILFDSTDANRTIV